MAEPFLSEIRIMSFGFAPRGWAMCNGQLLPINQNQALFALMGTSYGGDGRTNFALPDLQGRTPIHMGSGHWIGERGGEQSHALTGAEVDHAHDATVSTLGADRDDPASSVWAVASAAVYGDSADTTMAPGAVGNVGGGQAHINMQPFLTLNFSIALQGIFPSSY